MDGSGYSNAELLATVLARLIDGARHVVVGANSPIPAAAALLANALGDGVPHVTLLGSRRYSQFTDGGKELFDYAAQGRMDAFFVGGGQIDGAGNINLVGIGDYPGDRLRLPGSYGSAFLYHLVPNVILFRNEHSRRVLVPKVDFVSAPGVTPPNVYRVGGPKHLVTERVHMTFNAREARFRLASIHPGFDLAGVSAETGFDFECPVDPPSTPAPEPYCLDLLRGAVRCAVAECYPAFAATAFAAD